MDKYQDFEIAHQLMTDKLNKGKFVMEKIVITYKNSDLDCLASAYAYSEYLNKIGEKASYYVYGKVQKEAEIVCELFNIAIDNAVKEITNEDIIAVDTNSLSSIDYVNPDNIVLFIDHHPNSGDIQLLLKSLKRIR